MKRCLWVVPKAIYPVRDGARVANRALIKAFRPQVEELDVLLFNDTKEEEADLLPYKEDFNPNQIYFFQKNSYGHNKFKKLGFLLKSFLCSPSLPVTTGYYHTQELNREVEELLKKNNYDLIVFDGLHPYTAFFNATNLKETPIVYRAHNVEADLWRTAATKTQNWLFRCALLWQASKVDRLENKIIAHSQKTWCIAQEDLERFSQLHGQLKEKLTLIPVGLDFKKVEKIQSESEKIRLLFLGKMDWAPNKDGLKWFLTSIWPKCDHQKLELHIVGSGDSSWAQELVKQPSILFKGFVKELDSAYANADFCIIPIRYGSGTRIKVIESISKNVPIISTAMGVQGSGLIDFYQAENEQEWIDCLNSLSKAGRDEMANKAFISLEKIYSPSSIAKKAFDSLI